MRQNVNAALNIINERHSAYMAIINYFTSAEITKLLPSDSYNTVVEVCNWYRHDMKRDEILKMVDDLIEKCPNTGNFFSLMRVCNCVYIEAKDTITQHYNFTS